MVEHDFLKCLNDSKGVELGADVEELLLRMIPGSVTVKRATNKEDREGTDLWILRRKLPAVSVDLKVRTFDPIERFGSDDACIETTSVYSGKHSPPWEDRFREKVGWTLNETKRTDLVLYTWPTKNGLRFWAMYFPWLCVAAKKHWRHWVEKYKERPAKNKGYLTLNVYPPRKEIAQAVGNVMRGNQDSVRPGGP